MKNISSIELAREARVTVLQMIYRSQCSHIGSALSAVDILSVLYADFLKNNPENPDDPNRDRLILSKGHACSALYAILAEMDYFNKQLLETYAQNDSVLMSHISSQVPGVEFSTGSLGHGLPVGVGLAIAAKRKKQKHKIIVLMSDGELNAGSNFEAIMFAAQHRLDNLYAVIDVNKLQAMGFTSSIIDLEPLEEKFKVFKWNSRRGNGHDHVFISSCLKELSQDLSPYPKVFIADTIKGKGISFMENRLEWHYKSPSIEDFKKGINELGE